MIQIPLSHVDSLPPAIADESELPLKIINNNSAEASTQNNAECFQAEANNTKALQSNTIDDSTSDLFNIHTDTNIYITSDQSDTQYTQEQTYWEIEKIIAKRTRQGKVKYREKWFNFESKFNAWVKYDDLSDACKQVSVCILVPLRKEKFKKYITTFE